MTSSALFMRTNLKATKAFPTLSALALSFGDQTSRTCFTGVLSLWPALPQIVSSADLISLAFDLSALLRPANLFQSSLVGPLKLLGILSAEHFA